MRQLCPIIDRGHFIIHKVTQTRSVLTQKVLVTHTHRGGRGQFGVYDFHWMETFPRGIASNFPPVNKIGPRKGEKRAELAEDTLLGAITRAISESDRI